MKDKLIVHVSFKTKNIEDIKLYNWICQKSSKSGFIKDIMRAEMLKEEQKNKPTKNEQTQVNNYRIRVYVSICKLLSIVTVLRRNYKKCTIASATKFTATTPNAIVNGIVI